ncbi:acyltransferase family protein [Flavobacterium koreense]
MGKNNFDFLRLLFATFVIITHSYPLSGNIECDWLCEITNSKMLFSYLGVRGFFIISGYLIFQSLLRSKGLVDYYWKRFLRLFPALLVVLLLTVILAPLVYDSNVSYLSNPSIYSYVYKNMSLYRLQYTIPGVFENNIYGSAINGSLWTICYEFSMYLLLSALILFRSNLKILRLLLVLLLVAFGIFFFFFKANYEFTFYQLSSGLLSDLGIYFLAGSFFASIHFEKLKSIKLLLLVSFIILALNELFIDDFSLIRFVFLPILVIGFGLQSTKFISSINEKIGDISYGIYIYGFPVQQTLMHYYKFSPTILTLLSIPITVVFAFASWHLIEKKALSFKKINPLELVSGLFLKPQKK